MMNFLGNYYTKNLELNSVKIYVEPISKLEKKVKMTITDQKKSVYEILISIFY